MSFLSKIQAALKKPSGWKLSQKSIKWVFNYINAFNTKSIRLPSDVETELRDFRIRKPTKLFRVLTSKSRGLLENNIYKTNTFTSWSKSKKFVENWGEIAAGRSGDSEYKIISATFGPKDTIVDIDNLVDVVEGLESLESEVLVAPNTYQVDVSQVFRRRDG